MLLKDCPVGSVVRLVSICGKDVHLPYWISEFEVKKSGNGVYVTDKEGDNRCELSEDPDFQFEIVRPAPEPEPAPEPRITFTVGGQEFYVGQRVWSDYDYGLAPIGKTLEIIGPYNGMVVTRVENTSMVANMSAASLSTTPPTPHEWKRGDWARHEEFGECFVCSGVDFAGEVRVDFLSRSFSVKPETLTFIKHIDLPS